jgi:exodeoxyribonuclease V
VSIELDFHQRGAMARIAAWRRERPKQVFRLFGYAGTGKTTLATQCISQTGGIVMFAAFTGKASMVLNAKLVAAGMTQRASTIHSLIYIPLKGKGSGKRKAGKDAARNDDDELRFMLNPQSPLGGADLLVIDEVSMVDRRIARDLESFHVPILVIGDPAQFAPVKGMEHYVGDKPDVLLTEIHRQAEGNQILQIAKRARVGLPLPARGEYGSVRIIDRHEVTPEILLAADIRLVGKNSTRHIYNDRIRHLLGFGGEIPGPGETVVCLRNCYEFHVPIFNGQLFTVLQSKKRAVRWKGWECTIVEMEIRNDLEETVTVEVPVEFFYGLEREVPEPVRGEFQQFAFGYALTVHKSQGSEWDKVLLLDQPVGHYCRWRYTGITRAAKSLVIVR